MMIICSNALVRAIKTTALISGLAILGSAGAHADTMLYADFGSYSAAVTGISTVNIPTIPQDQTNLGSGDAAVTYENVTFSTSSALSNGNFFNVNPSFSGVPSAVLSSQEQTVGIPNILVSLPSAVTGFSLDYGTFLGGNVTFTLSNGDAFTLGSALDGYATAHFFGVTDTTAFTSVLLTINGSGPPPLDDVLSLNDVTFGSLSVAAAAPEPSTWAMMILGFFGVGAMGYRRRKFTAIAA
jgi:hypothetical protein